jgi:hypothetical protein
MTASLVMEVIVEPLWAGSMAAVAQTNIYL